MINSALRILRALLGLLAILCLAAPLRAQTQPRLQASGTDFLDMFQQSSSAQARPEILTMFDFSRSMASLMFHPLYQNNDLGDADDYRYMGFTVTPSGGGTIGNNTYYIYATDATCTSSQQWVEFVVAANNSVTTTYSNNPIACSTLATPTTYTIQATAAGAAGAYSRITATPVNNNANTPYNFTFGASTGQIAGTGGWASYQMSQITMTVSGTNYTSGTIQVAHGVAVTFTADLTHTMGEGEPAGLTCNAGGDNLINWSTATCSTEAGSSPNFSSTATWTVPSFAGPGTTNPTLLKPITVTGTIHGGDTITMSTYYQTQGSSSTINWTQWGGNTDNCVAQYPVVAITGGSPTATQTTANTTSGGSVTWTIPAYCATLSGTTNATLTGYLDPRAGLAPVPGVTYLANTLTFVGLVKPNGTLVTASDAAGPYTTSGPPYTPPGCTAANALDGMSFGANDARNWLRVASHARFSYAIAKNGLPYGSCEAFTRTIDIPLPWKIVNPTAAISNPLASLTVTDSTTSKGVTYGSGNQIEMDGCYAIEGSAGCTFYTANSIDFNTATTYAAATAAQATTVILYDVAYRPAYISWLFNGQYQGTNAGKPNYTTDTINLAPPGTSTTLPGNLIVYDAVTKGIAAGQSTAASVAWGQGFLATINSGTTWGNVKVPQYSTAGTYNNSTLLTVPTYTGEVTQDASGNQTPTFTRLQAVKRAAIQTWIANQEVYWALRFLDVTNEAVNGTASNIDNNSLSHWANTSYESQTPAYGTWPYHSLNGQDSAWVVLNNTSAQGNTSASGNSVTGMERIANLFAYGSTPLTYAVARTMAQFTDPSSVFNSVEGTSVSQCANSFLILFTDGIDNNGLAADNMVNPNTFTPYVSGTGSTAIFNALAGNQTVAANPTWVNPPTPFISTATLDNCWNIYTFAGIAAHLGDSSFGGTAGTNFMTAQYPPPNHTSQAPSAYLPLAITERNSQQYASPHLITTMTVGVSLGGYYNQTGSPKQNLFLAALVGDPNTKGSTTTAISSFHQFVPPVWNNAGTVVITENDWIPLPTDPTSYPTYGEKAPGAVYFFDGTNPVALAQGLGLAVALAIGTTSNNATANPDLPFLGATFGQEVYIGKFQPPQTGGVIWPGDLLMFTDVDNNGTFDIVDTSGNPVTTLSAATAQWAASNILGNNRLWSARTLITRLPGNATNPELGLHTFSDTGTAYTNTMSLTNTAGLENFVALDNLTAGSTAQVQVIQNAAGGNTLGPLDMNGRPTTNRLNIMGDVIDSNPASLQYYYKDPLIQAGLNADTNFTMSGSNLNFRLVLVGTNQGWLHAFGEVSQSISVENGTKSVVQAQADELWAFMPTDFLNTLDYVYGAQASANPHRFMVDGAPAIYFLDLPNATTGALPLGYVDLTANSQERAIAIIGLGKGGRSYYALDVHNPFSPVLLWSLVPDEASFFPGSRNLTSMTTPALQTLIGNMGFSTCTPGVGRVLFTSGGVQTVRDVVFLGGGLSVPQIEANFPTYPPPNGQNTFLGRSVLAIDVYTGQVLAAANLPSAGDSEVTALVTSAGGFGSAGAGPIVAGVVPTEVELGSGMAQRAYFLDRNGGLWAWGSKAVVGASSSLYPTYANFRMDTSDLAAWTVDGNVGSAEGIRLVAQDNSGKGAVYTTLPAPFVVGTFPGVAKSSASPSPSAMGVAMESGDRYNPMDGTYYLGTPTNFRLGVVFDRQDSRTWGFDSQNGPDAGIQDINLKNFTGNTFTASSALSCSDPIGQYITPGCSNYYLDPSGTGATTYFGYYVNLGSAVSGFLPKGITTPEVVSDSLFYTYFTPSVYDPCMGGSGTSYTNLIADVINPIVVDNRAGLVAASGQLFTWSGVASSLSPFGTRGVIQGGTIPVSNPVAGQPSTTPIMKTFLGNNPNQYPKVLVWRTVN